MEIQEKTINLVYDHWEDGVEVANASQNFPDYRFFNSIGLFTTHICHLEDRKTDDLRKINIQKFNLHEVKKNPDLKYFYVVSSPLLEFCHFNDINLNFKDIKSFFSNEVITKFKNNSNFYLIFTREHEPIKNSEIECFKNFCLNFELDTNRIFYVNNNSLSNHLSQIHNINLHKINFIDYSSTKILKKNVDVNFKPEKNGKFFMCRNRNPKQHRLNLLFHLEKNNILNNINYSLLQPLDEDDTEIYKFTLNDEEIKIYKNIIKKLSVIKKDDIEGLYDYYDEKTHEWKHPLINSMQYPEIKEIYENSYINIITESEFFDSSVIHISEKSLRPFYYYQIPLILTTPNHINKMKEKYDFDFFDDIINHSYDKELDPRNRIFMFIEEIKRINENQDKIKEFYKNNQERFELNRKKLLKIALDKTEDFDFFWNLI